MNLQAGDKLGPYEILAPIGAGGMGEVYRARDPRLDRDVAVKVSAAQFSERFEREAKAIAALNHSNICQIYDVGPNYLVMEYIEGTPLKGPLPVDQALKYAAQICDALDAAHSKKITHRDLKPANILVTKQGIKLLDFGLAKIDKPIAVAQETVTMALTSQGQILGTLLYMSPEQLQGKEADSRSDIFSFGCVLYEMLTGKRAFDGSSAASVIAAILERLAPSVSEVAPPALDRVLNRCLEKDPENRWQTARDLKAALELVSPAVPEAVAAAAQPVRAAKAPWTVAAIFAIAALGLGAIAYKHSKEEPPGVLKFVVPQSARVSFGTNPIPAISPDGKRVVFSTSVDGKISLVVRELDSLDIRPLPGTEGAFAPFWSPDSRTVAFFTADKLKRIDIAGGQPVAVCDMSGGGARGGTWAPGGKDLILFAVNEVGTFQVAAAGGTPVPVTKPDKAAGELSHNWPEFLPGGRRFLYSVVTTTGASDIYVSDLESGLKKKILSGTLNARYANGYLLFPRDGVLRAQIFDSGKLETGGDAMQIAVTAEIGIVTGTAFFSASQTGSLAYISWGSGSGSGITQLTWFDRFGKRLGTVGPFPRIQGWPALSPDGSSVALSLWEGGDADLWLHDLNRGTTSRFTFGPKTSQYPIWSPDGRSLGFSSNRDGERHPWQKPMDRGKESSLNAALGDPPHSTMPEDWSRDGRYVVERVVQTSTADDIWIQPLFGDKKPFPYLQGPGNERNGSLSPDGKWLLYSSDETGRFEIYVQAFPVPGGKVQISNRGGERPRWSSDGKEIYFIGTDLSMMAVSVRTGAGFDAGQPTALFDSQIAGGFNDRFDVSKDGRFLVPTQAEQSSAETLTIVVNWPAGLKK